VTVPRLVDVSTTRDTPLDVLAACREVVPTAELVYVGDGRWWLGWINDTPAKDLGYDPPKDAYFQHALQRQGFRWLGEYPEHQVTAGYLRKELEFMFSRSENDMELDFLVAMDHSEGEYLEREKIAVARDKAASDGRDIYRKIFKKLVSVQVH
jgi:hypothetical protein